MLKTWVKNHVPVGSPGECGKNIAAAAAFCLRSCKTTIQGQTLIIDGGWGPAVSTFPLMDEIVQFNSSAEVLPIKLQHPATLKGKGLL